MDLNKLDKDLTAIVEKRIELSKLTYADEDYDVIEEAMHDLEDDFNEEFGDALEGELEKIYEKLDSDTDILLPSAYLANKYIPMLPDAKGVVSYEVDRKSVV